jgi:hypothetical protein
MSSEISIDDPGVHRTSPPTRGGDPGLGHPNTPNTRGDDPGLQPWQFFLLAGMLSATGVVLVAAGQPPASIIVLSLTVVAASFVALGTYRFLLPLVSPEAVDTTPLIVGRTRAAIEREKTLVLRSIKELEFDYAMGKIAKGDFDEMGGKLRARAIGLMRQLDAAGSYKATIEHELQTRLEGQGFSPGNLSSATRLDNAAAVANVAREGNARPEGDATPKAVAFITCTCGTANDADARFCKTCGDKLAAA